MYLRTLHGRIRMMDQLLSFTTKFEFFSRQGEEWSQFRKILSPLLLKMATLHRHIESLNDVADRLIDQWEHMENGLITNLERDLYCYFVQVCSQ